MTLPATSIRSCGVLPDKIVYDAQTTSGGSGGPLFNNEGKVIGTNFAMVREVGGSNFAIPVGYGKSLLKPSVPAPLQKP
jgi:S1-C subfamily serine protease